MSLVLVKNERPYTIPSQSFNKIMKKFLIRSRFIDYALRKNKTFLENTFRIILKTKKECAS